MKSFKLIAIGGLMLMLLGCREYKHYSYKHVEIDLWKGRLQVGIEGRNRDYEESGKRYQVRENPYMLTFRFWYPNVENIEKFEISKATLVGLQDKAVISLGERESLDKYDYEKWSNKNDKRMLMATSYDSLKNSKLFYQAYELSFIINLYRDSRVIESKVVKIKLETDFKKGKRSDFYDSMMGI